MCEVEIYPRSVCVRTAPGNVNMVAYGKINTRLSPDVTSAAVAARRIAVRSRFVCRHLDNIYRPTRQPVRLPSTAVVGDGNRVFSIWSFLQVIPVDLAVPIEYPVVGRAYVVDRVVGRLDEPDAQPVNDDLEEREVDDHVMPATYDVAGVDVDYRKYPEYADRRETTHGQPEPRDERVVECCPPWHAKPEAGYHLGACVFWINKTHFC